MVVVSLEHVHRNVFKNISLMLPGCLVYVRKMFGSLWNREINLGISR